MTTKALLACLVLVAVAACPAHAEGPEATSSGVPQLAARSADGGRKLLRKTGREFKIDWSPRGYSPLRLPAGTIVTFKYRPGAGIGYGSGRCSYKATFDRNSRKGGSLSVKIPKGTTWFGDPSGSNCRRGAAIQIIGT
jgi:hypothetical protein